jgi:endonuclease/exonuclease/phosphatase family metal-dependent hydrolase
LVSYNIRHGLSDCDGRVDIDRFRAAVRALGADVLAIQEADRFHPRSARADFAALAATELGSPGSAEASALRTSSPDDLQPGTVAWHFAPTRCYRAGLWWPAPPGGQRPGRSPRWPVASYGIALVSRYPVRRWLRLNLPRPPLAYRLRHPLPIDEPRVAIAASLNTPGGPLTVVGTHLSALPVVAVEQLRALIRQVATLPRPLVLLGDLNLSAPQPQAITGWSPLATAATYPLARPTRQIDHILADGPVHALSPAVAVDTGLSDHRALVVDVALGAVRTSHELPGTSHRARSIQHN